MERNIITDVKENVRVSPLAREKTVKNVFFRIIGRPVFTSEPPGAALDEAKAKVAMSTATAEQLPAVPFIHSLASTWSCALFLINSCSAVTPSLFT